MKLDSGEFHLNLWHILISVKVGEASSSDEDLQAFLLLSWSRLKLVCNSLNIYQSKSCLKHTLQRKMKHTSSIQSAIPLNLAFREN
jgi:hypothetical protein